MQNEEIVYKIDSEVLQNYVNALNSINEPMNKIKEQMQKIIKKLNKSINDVTMPTDKMIKQLVDIDSSNKQYIALIDMFDSIKKMPVNYPRKHTQIITDVIKQILRTNKGVISTRMIEPLNISRQYLSIMEHNKVIEKVSRGIYISASSFNDSYYSFQIKFKKAVFSHMNALYFYGMTEEFPYNFTITVPYSYHVDKINKKCNVFYVNNNIYEIGLCEVETPNGNKVKAYDLERCICDIIRSRNRMDPEQVKKTIKLYVKSECKNISKLAKYSKKMGINKQVMEMVGLYND